MLVFVTFWIGVRMLNIVLRTLFSRTLGSRRPLGLLDAETEDEILRCLTSGLPDRTLLIVTHRETVVRAADHIVRLESGNVLESERNRRIS